MTGFLKEKTAAAAAEYRALRGSKFARDAALLFALNLVSRALSFFGGAWAAKCLGPANLGVSALVQTTASQVSLAYNGGFDTVSVRRIAHDKARAAEQAGCVVTFRLLVAAAALLLWLAAVPLFVPGYRQAAWMTGGVLLLTLASNVTFAFQGLERLPVQNAIAAGTSLLMAASYFAFFRPGMFLGADLIVLAVVGVLSSAASWWFFRRETGSLPLARPSMAALRGLLGESWRYWVLALVGFFYTLFQFPLISHFLGDERTGVFRSAFLLASGVEMLYGSINSLLLPRMVNWKKQGLPFLISQQRRLLRIFLAIGLPLTAALILTAPWIYRIFFGSAYLDGIRIFQILAVGRLVVFVVQIYTWGAVAIGLDTEFLLATVTAAVFSVGCNLLLIPALGLTGAAMVSVATEVLLGAATYVFLRRAAKRLQALAGGEYADRELN